jgi:hypothetical protein
VSKDARPDLGKLKMALIVSYGLLEIRLTKLDLKIQRELPYGYQDKYVLQREKY